MSKTKFVIDLIESNSYQAFEIQAMMAAEKGEKFFQFGNATYDVEFAANVMVYIYHTIQKSYEQQHLLHQQEPGTDTE